MFSLCPPLINITEYYNYQVLENGEFAYAETQQIYPYIHSPTQQYVLLRSDIGTQIHVWEWSAEDDCILHVYREAYTWTQLINQQLANSTYLGEMKIPFGGSSYGDLWQQELQNVIPNALSQTLLNRIYVSPTNSSIITFIGSLTTACDCEESDCSTACAECESDPSTCASSILFQSSPSQFDYAPIPSSVLDIPSFCPSPLDFEVTLEEQPFTSTLDLLRKRLLSSYFAY